jgi:hypothetical protein
MTAAKVKKRRGFKEGMPVGRPSSFEDRLRNIMVRLAREGKTDVEIAEICGIDVTTLCLWKSHDASFYQSINQSKNIPDQLVEMSLFKKALGYKRKVTKVFCYEGQIITHEHEEEVPPDATSQIFWLKNRQPGRWRDKQDITIHNEDDLLTDAQLRAKILAMLKMRKTPEEREVQDVEVRLLEKDNKQEHSD